MRVWVIALGITVSTADGAHQRWKKTYIWGDIDRRGTYETINGSGAYK